MEKQNSKPIMGTVFSNKLARQGKPLSLAEWIQQVANGRWAKEVNAARLLVANGRPEQAKAIKNDLPMFVCNALCLEGRLQEKITKLGTDAMIDCDRHDLDWSTRMSQQIKELPFVIAAYVTFSGGLRIFVNVGKVHPTQWKTMYKHLVNYMDRYLGEPCDRACSNVLRATYPSYDPEAWCRNLEDTTLFPFPDDLDLSQELVPSQISPMLSHPQTGGTQVEPDEVLERFFNLYTFNKGERHNRLVFLGQYARWCHLMPHQVEEFISLAHVRCAQPDLQYKEYKQAIEWGYNHSQEAPQRFPSFQGETSQTAGGVGSTKVHGSTGTQSAGTYPANGADNQSKEANSGAEEDEETVIAATCPTFPDELFDHLPDFIRRALVHTSSKRERDMLLMAILSNLSACLPYIRSIYRRRKYSPHLYFVAVAPAGTGKGVLSLASRLPEKINDAYLDTYDQLKERYKKACTLWELEQRRAIKEKREPDWNLEPVAPTRQILIIPPETSKSQMIFDLEASGEIGMIMCSSEISAITEALKSKYGNHTSLIRICFHHETLSKNYKVDGRVVMVKHPRLAICASGTLQQLFELVGTLEDGTFSRFLGLTAPAIDHWVSDEETDQEAEDDTLYDKLAEEVKQMFDFFNQGHEIMIRITPSQHNRHNLQFSDLFNETATSGEEGFQAILGRHGLSAIRIAMILSALRIYEGGMHVNEYTCTDEDFDTALALVKTLLQHSLQLSTILDQRNRRNELRRYNRVNRILNRLPIQFTYTQYLKAAEQEGVSRSSAKRSLRKLVQNHYLHPTEKGYHQVGIHPSKKK